MNLTSFLKTLAFSLASIFVAKQVVSKTTIGKTLLG